MPNKLTVIHKSGWTKNERNERGQNERGQARINFQPNTRIKRTRQRRAPELRGQARIFRDHIRKAEGNAD